MRIAVCIKEVPDSWAKNKLVNGVLDRKSVEPVLNNLDEYAVEEALRIVEAHGGNGADDGPHQITAKASSKYTPGVSSQRSFLTFASDVSSLADHCFNQPLTSNLKRERIEELRLRCVLKIEFTFSNDGFRSPRRSDSMLRCNF